MVSRSLDTKHPPTNIGVPSSLSARNAEPLYLRNERRALQTESGGCAFRAPILDEIAELPLASRIKALRLRSARLR